VVLSGRAGDDADLRRAAPPIGSAGAEDDETRPKPGIVWWT